jgi:hypothetical protein
MGHCVRINNSAKPSSLDIATTSFVDKLATVFFEQLAPNNYVQSSLDAKYYLVDGLGKISINDSRVYSLYSDMTPITLSQNYLDNLISSTAALDYIVKEKNTNNYYLVDEKTKCPLATLDIQKAWLRSTLKIPELGAGIINTLPNCANGAVTYTASDSLYNYYTLDSGSIFNIPSLDLLQINQRIDSNKSTRLSPPLLALLGASKGSLTNPFVSLNKTYISDKYQIFAINSPSVESWTAQGPKIMSDLYASRFQQSPSIIKNHIRYSSAIYLASNKNLININAQSLDFLGGQDVPTLFTNSPLLPIQTTKSSHLITNNSQDKVWLVSGGKKYYCDGGFAEYVSLGYISAAADLLKLDDATIANIADSSTCSMLIKSPTSGVKLLDFGVSLGFAEADTLNNYTSVQNQVIIVSQETFDKFPLKGNTSKFIKDDKGKIYLLENGKKRWISSASSYAPYVSIPVKYLRGTTISLIPDGVNL